MPTMGVTDTTTFRSSGAFTPQAITVTANRTLTVADSGKVFIVNAVDLVMQLPYANRPLTYTFIVRAASSVTGLIVRPQATDSVYGNGFTVVAGKGAVDTAATDAVGDSITLYSDGSGNWFIQNVAGTWAREA